jgi:hypothetical protein
MYHLDQLKKSYSQDIFVQQKKFSRYSFVTISSAAEEFRKIFGVGTGSRNILRRIILRRKILHSKKISPKAEDSSPEYSSPG